MTTSPTHSQQIMEEISRELNDLWGFTMPRLPRYRYYVGPRGERYCWTTEPYKGKFACWTWQPIGPGSRSGKPTHWKAADYVEFARRKVAKARAYARLAKAYKTEN